MKSKIPAVLVLLLVFSAFNKAESEPQNIDNFKQICTNKNQYFAKMPIQKGTGVKTFKRWRDFWEPRLFPNDSFPNLSRISYSAIRFVNTEIPVFPFKNWKEYGPFIIPSNTLAYPSSGLGRVSCIAVNPRNPHRIFIGSASGGLWVSSNSGISWDCVQSTQIMSVGISDIKYSADTSVLYAATGDVDGATMSRNYSLGIIKSSDGGKSWSIIGDSAYYDENYLISSILTFPENKFSACAGTNHGIIFTSDGFKTISGISLEGVSIRALALSEIDSNIILAAVEGNDKSFQILKSIDRGTSWNKVLTVPNSSRIAFTFSKLSGNKVFAIASKIEDNGFAGFYESDDAGSSWTLKSDSPNILAADADGRLVGGQGNYDLCIETSPTDSNSIFIGGVNIWKSTNCGISWSPVTHWSGDAGLPFVHADHHSLFYLNDTTLFSCNDGGIYISKNNGNTWKDYSNGLSITQIYRLNLWRKNPNLAIVGTQDNGTLLADGINWQHIFGGDGMGCIYSPDDQFEMFFSINNGSIYRSLSGGERPEMLISEEAVGEKSQWISVIAMNPQNHETIYAGFENLWASSEYGNTGSWQKISNFSDGTSINAVAINSNDSNNILIAKQNLLYETHNYGISWSKIFSAPNVISSISIDSVNSVFISCSGYSDTAKVFRRRDDSWQNLSAGLPNVPVSAITCDYQNASSVVYIGSDIGCFWLNPMKNRWEKFGNSLPNIVINSLDFDSRTRTLAAGTFGRGMWKCQSIQISHEHIFDYPAKTYRMCSGDSLVLDAKSDLSVFWSDNSVGNTITIKKSGKYFAYTPTQAGDIIVSDTIEVIVIPNLTKIQPDKQYYCVGDAAVLSADSSFSSVIWNTGDRTVSITSATAGTYFFSASTPEGCSVQSDTFNLVFHPIPPKPSITRIGNSLITDFTDTTDYELLWFSGDSLISRNLLIYNITELGNYYLLVKSRFGCVSSSDTLMVTSKVESEPIIFNGDKISISRGEIYSFRAGTIPSKIDVYNLSGSRISDFSYSEAAGQISFQSLGTYIALKRFKYKSIAIIFLVN